MIEYTETEFRCSQEVMRALLAFMPKEEPRCQPGAYYWGLGFDGGDPCATDGKAALRFSYVRVPSDDSFDVLARDRRIFIRPVCQKAFDEARERGASVVVLSVVGAQ